MSLTLYFLRHGQTALSREDTTLARDGASTVRSSGPCPILKSYTSIYRTKIFKLGHYFLWH
jgi:hypothetical protein